MLEGGLPTSAFDRHLAEEQKALAITLKQDRLWREEQDAIEATVKKKNKRGGKGAPEEK